MTNDEIKLKDMEERIKKLENKVFGMWMDQYETEYDISEEPWDPEPWIPTQGASQEMIDKAMREHKEWEERQNNFKGKFTVS